MSYLDQLFDRVSALSGEPLEVLAPAIARRSRAEWLSAELERRRAEHERAIPQAADALVAGADFAEVAVSLAAADLYSFNSPLSTAAIGAVAVLHRQAGSEARRLAQPLWEALARACRAIVVESVRLARTLPAGVVDERTAFRASKGGVEHFRTWDRLSQLNAKFNELHEAARVLLHSGFLGVEPVTHGGHAEKILLFTVWRNPSKVPKAPTPLLLAAAELAGAGPGLHEWSYALAAWRSGVTHSVRAYDVTGKSAGPLESQSALSELDDSGVVGLPPQTEQKLKDAVGKPPTGFPSVKSAA